jgi:tetratricopeptide (TPR) repeat protein
LDLATIVRLHKVPVTPARVLYRAHHECINFFVDHQAELELRHEGVVSEIIEGLKSACVDLSTNVEERRARYVLEQRIGNRTAAEQYHAAARAFMRAQRFGAAEGEIREAIRLVNNNSEYYFLLAMAYFHQRKCDIALRAFETATHLNRSIAYFAYANAGHCFQLVHEGEKAYSAYRRALDYAPALSGRGWLLDRISELPGHDE